MLLLIALPLVFCSASALQSTVNRDVSVELILETGAIAGLQHGWGPSSRKADHATVAINSERDICVVFHTDRDQGLAKPAHILQPHSCGVRDVVHMTAIACMPAQELGPSHMQSATSAPPLAVKA